MQKLLIATTNSAKLAEYKEFLQELPVELVSLSDLKIAQQAPEDAETISENAIHKALFYNKLSNLPTIADDGGFEIDYLGGAPGVRSHRWIGDKEATDDEIIAFTLKKMQGVPFEKRTAHLRLVLAFVKEQKVLGTVEEKVTGIVALKPSVHRRAGFPYRSLLFFREVNKFYDELTPAEMEKYNHRKKAAERLKSIVLQSL